MPSYLPNASVPTPMYCRVGSKPLILCYWKNIDGSVHHSVAGGLELNRGTVHINGTIDFKFLDQLQASVGIANDNDMRIGSEGIKDGPSDGTDHHVDTVLLCGLPSSVAI